MAEKRFVEFLTQNVDDGNLNSGFQDITSGKWYYTKDSENAKKICELLNELHDENTKLKKENEELKELIRKLEKQIHLIHMASMFSTVKSFKGDVSKRYKYSEETDTIYDTANRYGQYSKILDKKEVVMLLNEYETLLDGALND